MRGIVSRILSRSLTRLSPQPRLLSPAASPPPAAAAALPGEYLKWTSLGSSRGSKFATGFTPLKPKPLSSIIDATRAAACSPEELVSVWDHYHLGRGHIGVSIKAQLYHLLEQRSLTCRHFVIPLQRGSGYTTMFIQGMCGPPCIGARASGERSAKLSSWLSSYATSVQMPHMLFTGLEDYKARGTQASPYFTVTHYTEFAESKGIVLIRGDVVFTSKLSDSEAKSLLEIAQSFYLNDNRYKLVERFNRETHEFEFKEVLQALEIPTL